MMQVRGAALIPMVRYIDSHHGESMFTVWLNSLNPLVRMTFERPISSIKWFPLKEFFSDPTLKYCTLFHNGSLRGAWELGRISADYSLNSFLKVFMKIRSVNYTLKHAIHVLPTYYSPSAMELDSVGENTCIIRFSEFSEMAAVVEERIAGWIERVLEIHGCSIVNIDFLTSIAKGDKSTEFELHWK
jgi:hypothetical protein